MKYFRLFNQPKRRVMLGVSLVVLVGAAAVFLQVSSSPQTCTTSIPAEQDIQQALAFGAAFESPRWEQLYADHGDNISARWQDETGLAHLDFLRYNCGLTVDNLDNYRFEISLDGYDSWERVSQCESQDLRLHEFAVVYAGDQDYRVRFWLKPVNDTRLAAFHLSFPAEQANDMETYAARLFPELSTCL